MILINLLSLLVMLFIVGVFSFLAGRAMATLWRKCDRYQNSRRTQQQITMGKSHLR
jgi:hypothetical protein